VNLVFRIVFALGVALAAFAGMLAPVVGVSGHGPAGADICFVVVVIGGIRLGVGARWSRAPDRARRHVRRSCPNTRASPCTC
jgi:hypothetical protein